MTLKRKISWAVLQHVTLEKGQTVHLSCPIAEAHKNNVEWRNPEGYVMFFSDRKAIKDKRYTINKLSESEFSISISNVTFKDGGIYVCSQYGRHTTETKVQVTVLGYPKMSVAKHGGKTFIKCTAEGNHQAPEMSWQLGNGPEFQAHTQVSLKDKKYVSMDILRVNYVKRKATVKCLARHPALHSHPLINFVKIGRGALFPLSPTTSTGAAQPPGSEALSTLSSSRATVHSTPTPVTWTSQTAVRSLISQATAPTGSPLTPDSSTHSPLSQIDNTTSPLSTIRGNDTDSTATSTTGWTTVDNRTEEVHTGGNRTVIVNYPETQAAASRSSLLMIFLVTCLVVALLVVVIFFAIKLRRAHIVWKRENEESNPSEESSKSKSSQEEKSIQQQRGRGLFNTAFTKYIDEPTATTTRTASVQEVNKEQIFQPQTLEHTSAKCDIKETEL
ncbi:uncharacterized protein crtam isoform X2 [Halichoeres trimaculatus]|uniref:uncharacterized protein crtam isoform X2 n=1 Tax=Halichoeres trimaculatus TaxID=147232 RepID=UPI003D9DE1BF